MHHEWHHAKKGPKGVKESLLERAAVAARALGATFAGPSLGGVLGGVGLAFGMVLVCAGLGAPSATERDLRRRQAAKRRARVSLPQATGL